MIEEQEVKQMRYRTGEEGDKFLKVKSMNTMMSSLFDWECEEWFTFTHIFTAVLLFTLDPVLGYACLFTHHYVMHFFLTLTHCSFFLPFTSAPTSILAYFINTKSFTINVI